MLSLLRVGTAERAGGAEAESEARLPTLEHLCDVAAADALPVAATTVAPAHLNVFGRLVRLCGTSGCAGGGRRMGKRS